MTDFRATYRLQLGPDFTFADARELVPYLRELGISHLYLSPSLQARRGSTHGYDVVDPRRISEDLGGEEEFRRLARAGLGVVLDIVPNHMATDEEQNPFWRDPDLREKFFDVDPETGEHRRFFDVGELGGLRQEDPEVFEATHELVLRLVEEGLVQGLRIDHPDGLADPAGYLRRLQERGAEHVWVEKILEPGEQLRDWPVEGTVGYEFMNDLVKLFVDPDGEEPLTELYAELTGTLRPFEQVAFECKYQEAETTFGPETARLRRELGEPLPELERALASFHVYRTYVEPWSGAVGDEDRDAIAAAELPERLARILLLEEPGYDAFVARFQQTTGPVMAKGVEDTAFYRYNRLLALNQVGGNPGEFGIPVEEFHAASAARARRFPRALLTTQTHDTKRSGDVTARLTVLPSIAAEWADRVRTWRGLNEHLKTDGAPDGNEEYLIYQTLVGAWPLERERLLQYVEKALREAKTNTSWVAQNAVWEAAVKVFCYSLYDHEAFLADFEPFAEKVARLGERMALAHLALKVTSPGLPDVYQGDELWTLTLVDPDNRRPVDWELRRRLLDELRAGQAPRRETQKLYLLWKGLDLRARRPEAFAGVYFPLEAGPHVCAYLRGDDVLVVVPLRERGAEARVELPQKATGAWRSVLTGSEHELRDDVAVAELVDEWPVALLERVRATCRDSSR